MMEPVKKKSSTLVIVTERPGSCATCRHANQRTLDFRKGIVACGIDGNLKRAKQRCDVSRRIPSRSPIGPESTWKKYFFHQKYNGKNCTFGKAQDLRVLAEDADGLLRASLRADVPFIPAEK
jgi:hypothetical protein